MEYVKNVDVVKMLCDIIKFLLQQGNLSKLPLENFFLYLLRMKFGSHSILFKNGDEAKKNFQGKHDTEKKTNKQRARVGKHSDRRRSAVCSA